MSLRRATSAAIILLVFAFGAAHAGGLLGVDDSYTVALLHMNGPDESTTFTDESGKSWSGGGYGVWVDTAQSKFGGAAGHFIRDSYGSLFTPDSDEWWLDDGSNSTEWTIDYWARFDGDPGTETHGFVNQYQYYDNLWQLYLSNNTLTFQVRSGGADIVLISNSWNPAADTWYHVALVKQGVTGYKMFIDGTQIGTTQTDTSTIPNFAGQGGAQLILGAHIDFEGSTSFFDGWMDEPRLSKGIARWTSDFTPPTAEYPDASATATAANYQTQTAVALTATAANYQTQTAVALTATAANYQTQTAVALTATAANYQTQTAVALTATNANYQTQTAVALTATAAYVQTLTAMPTATHTATASNTPNATQTLIARMTATAAMATARESLSTPSIESTIEYGDLADLGLLGCVGLVLALGFVAWLLHSFMVPKGA